MNVAKWYKHFDCRKLKQHMLSEFRETTYVYWVFACLSLCFCLFVWGVTSLSRMFHSYGYITTTSEGLQILTFVRHSWPLSSEGSSACHIYCNTGHLFIIVISEDPWHSHLLQSIPQWSYQYLFLRLRSVAAGIRTPNLTHTRRAL